jgi:hypothetical protein
MPEPVPYVGVRLRNRPGLVGCPRSRLSRARLERAVARHAPAGVTVPVVDAPLVAEDLRRYVVGPIRRRWLRVLVALVGAVPTAVAAGAVLWALASNVHPALAVVAGLAICVAFGFATRFHWDVATTVTVDDVGIALDGRGVGWPRIGTVLLFDLTRPDGRTVPALGVARDLAPGGEPELLDYVTLDGVELDRRALEAATRTHAPDVAILDGPPARLTRTGGVVR